MTIAFASGVLAFPLGRRHEPQRLVLAHAISGCDGDYLRLAARQCAGLVEHDGVERGGLLQGERVLEQDAALCAQPGADHDRRRCRQPERVRAGDDDDGDREQQSVLHVAAEHEVPRAEGQETTHQGHEHKPERGAVGESLAWRLRVLRLLDELYDLGQGGVRPDGARARAPCAVDIDRRADELVARALVHRQVSPVTVDSST
jgi:hypothetical protein